MRRIAEYALTAACGVVRTCGVVVVATVLLSWLFSIEPDDGAPGPHPASGALVSKSEIETTHVRLTRDSDKPFSTYSLEGEDGEEILRVTYVGRGDVVVNLGEAFPIRPGFSARRDGNYEFALTYDGVGHRLKVSPDDASGFRVVSRSGPFGDGLGPVASDAARLP
jgi:hypothetical protein